MNKYNFYFHLLNDCCWSLSETIYWANFTFSCFLHPSLETKLNFLKVQKNVFLIFPSQLYNFPFLFPMITTFWIFMIYLNIIIVIFHCVNPSMLLAARFCYNKSRSSRPLVGCNNYQVSLGWVQNLTLTLWI